MKKLRMIITALIVLVIVGSAFSFKSKVYTFCVLQGTFLGNCTTYKIAFKIITTGTGNDYRYWVGWDGTHASCTTLNNGRCTAQIKLTLN
jgi:hypothetical protein